jgi:iron complex outermembrane receptor protein
MRDPRVAAGDILGQGSTSTDGARSTFAAYAEVALPFAPGAEAQLAARHDHYSDFGGATTPKVGVKYRVLDALLVRATWGRGFRAPSLPEISRADTTFFVNVIDPATRGSAQVSGVLLGNPDLRPEKSENAIAGIVWEPSRGVSLGVTGYWIDWKDVVAFPSFQATVDSGDPRRVIRDDATGRLVSVITGYQNLESTKVTGVDLDLSATAHTEIGRLRARGQLTYIGSFREEGIEYAGTNGGKIGLAIPKRRALLGIDWDRGPWSATANFRYTGGYEQRNLQENIFTGFTLPLQNGPYPRVLRHYRTLDLFGRWRATHGISVSVSVINAENEMPPFDPSWGNGLFDPTLFDVRGRQVRVGLAWSL